MKNQPYSVIFLVEQPDINKQLSDMCSQVILRHPKFLIFFLVDVPKTVNIFFKIIKQYLYGIMQLGVVFEGKFLVIIYFDIFEIYYFVM